MDVDVRQLAANEWALLRTVRLAALRDSPGAFAETAEDAAAWSADRWSAWLADAAVFLATTDGVAVGMVSSAGRARPEDRGLAALWVAPAARRTAVAGALLTAFLRWAEADGGRRVTLWVAPTNVAACRRYDAHGFVRTGSTRDSAIGPLVELALELPAGR